jgi:divalent metal cation (Fe/Co/Zn/Cd) transporter
MSDLKGDLIQPNTRSAAPACAPRKSPRTVVWLQLITIGWMVAECAISLYAARAADSPALLAFGSDSLVELLSAAVVLLQFVPAMSISERTAGRVAAILLFALAAIVTATSIVSFTRHIEPEKSPLGIAITIAALAAMPVLAALKRREARRIGNVALAADAVQSATCAWLAFVTLAGLALNAAFGTAWADQLAAVAAVPFLLKEARSAWKGHPCACH